MCGGADPCRARPMYVIAALSQASPYAGRRWPLRRIFRKKLAAADLPDGEKQCSSERLSSFCLSPECSENRAHPLGAHVLRWGRVALIGEPRFTIDEG